MRDSTNRLWFGCELSGDKLKLFDTLDDKFKLVERPAQLTFLENIELNGNWTRITTCELYHQLLH